MFVCVSISLPQFSSSSPPSSSSSLHFSLSISSFLLPFFLTLFTRPHLLITPQFVPFSHYNNPISSSPVYSYQPYPNKPYKLSISAQCPATHGVALTLRPLQLRGSTRQRRNLSPETQGEDEVLLLLISLLFTLNTRMNVHESSGVFPYRQRAVSRHT